MTRRVFIGLNGVYPQFRIGPAGADVLTTPEYELLFSEKRKRKKLLLSGSLDVPSTMPAFGADHVETFYFGKTLLAPPEIDVCRYYANTDSIRLPLFIQGGVGAPDNVNAANLHYWTFKDRFQVGYLYSSNGQDITASATFPYCYGAGKIGWRVWDEQ